MHRTAGLPVPRLAPRPTVVVAAATTSLVARHRSSSVALVCGMAVIWVAGLAG